MATSALLVMGTPPECGLLLRRAERRAAGGGASICHCEDFTEAPPVASVRLSVIARRATARRGNPYSPGPSGTPAPTKADGTLFSVGRDLCVPPQAFPLGGRCRASARRMRGIQRTRCHGAGSAPAGAGDFWPWPQKSPKGPLRNAVSKNFPRAVAKVLVGDACHAITVRRCSSHQSRMPSALWTRCRFAAAPGRSCKRPDPLAGGHRGLAPAPAREERAAAGASTLGVPLRGGRGVSAPPAEPPER